MKKKIVIDISDTGEIQLETKGFVGKSCIEETEFLKKILGEEIHRTLVPCYFRKNSKIKKHLPICG